MLMARAPIQAARAVIAVLLVKRAGMASAEPALQGGSSKQTTLNASAVKLENSAPMGPRVSIALVMASTRRLVAYRVLHANLVHIATMSTAAVWYVASVSMVSQECATTAQMDPNQMQCIAPAPRALITFMEFVASAQYV